MRISDDEFSIDEYLRALNPAVRRMRQRAEEAHRKVGFSASTAAKRAKILTGIFMNEFVVRAASGEFDGFTLEQVVSLFDRFNIDIDKLSALKRAHG